jgi:hypothetical protein
MRSHAKLSEAATRDQDRPEGARGGPGGGMSVQCPSCPPLHARCTHSLQQQVRRAGGLDWAELTASPRGPREAGGRSESDSREEVGRVRPTRQLFHYSELMFTFLLEHSPGV